MTEKSNGAIERDAISQRVEEIYKRLEFIDAYSAEARAGSILAVSYILSVLTYFEVSAWLKLGLMQVCIFMCFDIVSWRFLSVNQFTSTYI